MTKLSLYWEYQIRQILMFVARLVLGPLFWAYILVWTMLNDYKEKNEQEKNKYHGDCTSITTGDDEKW